METQQNGMYRLINFEKKTKSLSLIFFLILLFISVITIFLIATKRVYLEIINNGKNVHITPWWFYILPSFYSLYSIIEIILISIDIVTLKKAWSIVLNETNAQNFTPLFFLKTYRNLLKKQATSFWIAFSCIFYLSIFTAIIYGLSKIKNQTIVKRINLHNSFSDPKAFIWFLVSILILIAMTYIFKAISLKIRRNNFELFFSISSIDYLEISRLKSATHKFCFKVFLWSIFLLVLMPIALFILISKKMLRLSKKT